MSFKDLLAQQSGYIKQLYAQHGTLAQGWAGLSGAAVTDEGELNKAQRELIALCMGVAAQCEPCIAYHAQACVKYGVTRQQVADALGVCVMMGGGPKLMYGAKALAAFDEFSQPA